MDLRINSQRKLIKQKKRIEAWYARRQTIFFSSHKSGGCGHHWQKYGFAQKVIPCYLASRKALRRPPGEEGKPTHFFSLRSTLKELLRTTMVCGGPLLQRYALWKHIFSPRMLLVRPRAPLSCLQIEKEQSEIVFFLTNFSNEWTFFLGRGSSLLPLTRNSNAVSLTRVVTCVCMKHMSDRQRYR